MPDSDARAVWALEAWEEAACGLVQTRADGVFLRANRRFCQWVGRDAHTLVGRMRLQDLLTMGGRIFHQTHWAPLLQMQGSVSEVKLDIVHADGHAFPAVVNALSRQESGTVIQHVAVYVANDRDKYERELLLSRKRLEQAVAEAKDRALLAEQMIGIVSHDLRNPLSTIQMGALLLARTGATPEQLKVLDRVQRAGDRAQRLIADLLDFTAARLGSGIQVFPQPIDLHRRISESLEELALAFPGRGLRHVREGEGPAIADPDRIEQLLGNLVANAIAYGDPGAPVTVRSRIEPDAFEVCVHNNGSPIPQDLQRNLFAPLARGDGEGDKRSVGLGLYIVREIANAHGGQVTMCSSSENGTTFKARFPKN